MQHLLAHEASNSSFYELELSGPAAIWTGGQSLDGVTSI